MEKILSFIMSTVLMLSFAGCNSNDETNNGQTDFGGGNDTNSVKALMNDMTLEEKVWQMMFVMPEDIINIETAIQAGDATKEALESHPVGGIIYFAKNLKDRDQVKTMIANTQSYSKIPLFIAVDEEGGRVARLGSSGIIDKLPPMKTIGDMPVEQGEKRAAEVGEFLGKELTELGFNVDFAPVADIITVENNVDISDRSFGQEPDKVAKLVSAEVRAMQSNKLSATLKHFPSNGSTATNTHEGKGVCTRTLEQLRSEEFIPFKAGIEAGADMVMVAHMTVADIVENDTGKSMPSTLSKTVIEDLLRGECGFKKVVISDALNMGAITNEYPIERAAVLAVKAGVNMLLMPADANAAHAAVVNAVKSGDIQESTIDQSVEKILRLKYEKGML